jgi:murein DD-endopeptidase MepM/ murein hydrolase activator NlpD
MLDCAGAAGPWTQPVMAPVVSGFRTPSRPGHDGVDLGAARGTPIKAAAAGTVTVVQRGTAKPRLRRRRLTRNARLRLVR